MEFVIEIRVRDGEIVDTRFKEVMEIEEEFSQYAKIINPSWVGWCYIPKGSELMELRRIEMFANDTLKIRKKLKLNDVYEMLHLPKTAIGEIVGWRYSENNETGDNFVDFGIMNKRNIDFINGHGRYVVLDFNVDGII